ncbi:MAG: helix-turn-helix transcriptional regulator, partial [Pontixanthobacter sp.]
LAVQGAGVRLSIGRMKNGLRAYRKANGLSQLELADLVEVTRQSIIAIEAQKYDPSLPMAYRLAAFFNVPVEELFFNRWKPTGNLPDKESAVEEPSN